MELFESEVSAQKFPLPGQLLTGSGERLGKLFRISGTGRKACA
jgi:hypothetical protein